MAEIKLNARGLQCPGPIVMLFKQMKIAAPGDVVTIEVTDSGFKADVEAWCKKTGNPLQSLTEVEGVTVAVIVKG
jgi:tRNA 2-thiouridine synthesizing protein A